MKKLKLFNIIFALIIVFVFIYNNNTNQAKNSFLAINDDNVTKENTDDYTSDDQTVLEEENIELGQNMIIFDETNNIINIDNINYIRELLKLSSIDILKILNYDDSEVNCESNETCYFGTGMKIIAPKNLEVTENIDDLESIEDFSQSIDNEEVEAPDQDNNKESNTGDNDENNNSNSEEFDDDSDIEESSEDYVIYYVVVIGDVTGDGTINVDDVVKSKNEDKWETTFSARSNDNVNLNVLYKRALKVHDSSNNSYTSINTGVLSKAIVLDKKVNNIMDNKSYSISLKNKNITLGVSDKYKLEVTSENKANITYTSSEPAIAVVNENGIVTARKQGQVKITVSSGKNSEVCNVKVIVAPKSISFEEKTVNLIIGDSYKNVYKITPTNITNNSSIRFTSSNTSIATVSNDGTVKAKAEGESIITATTINNKSASYSVVVSKESNITLSSVSVTNKVGTLNMTDEVKTNDTKVDGKVLVGSSFKLVVSSKYSDNSDAFIKWKSNNTSVATINSTTGEVTTKKAGTATFYVSSGNSKISYTINVYNIKAGNNDNSLDIDIGKTKTIVVKITDENNNSVNIDKLKLEVIPKSNYFDTTINNNQITFKGVKELSDPTSCKILINNLLIGTVKIEVNDPSNDANGHVMFLDTQGIYSGKNFYESNESVILKSGDNKLALLDAAIYNPNICKKIVNYLHQYSGIPDNKVVTLEYLIVSHLHADHVGCVKYMLNRPEKIKVNNIIIKNESLAKIEAGNNISIFDWISNKVKKINKNAGNNSSKKINLIDTTKLKNSAGKIVKDNYIFKLGTGNKAMKLHLYNLSDIYSGEKKCKDAKGKIAVGKAIGFSLVNSKDKSFDKSSIVKVNTTNSENKKVTYYPYLKYANSTSILFDTSVKKDQEDNGVRTNFYANFNGDQKVCNANANSIAILAEIPIANNDSRFVYLTSDIENNGYPITGEERTIENKKYKIYGTGTTHFYKYTKSTGFSIKNNKLVPDTGKIIYKASEFWTAKRIANKYDTDKIVVYQASHHGFNNDKASIDLLKLNRSDMYVVALRNTSQANERRAFNYKSYHYTLANVTSNKKYRITGKGSIKFSILNNGNVKVKQ